MNLSGLNIDDYAKVRNHLAGSLKNYCETAKLVTNFISNIPDPEINSICKATTSINDLIEDFTLTSSSVESIYVSKLYETVSFEVDWVNDHSSTLFKIVESTKETLSFRRSILERIKNSLHDTSYVNRFFETAPTNKILKEASSDQVSQFLDRYYGIDNKPCNDIHDFITESLTQWLIGDYDFEYKNVYEGVHTKFEESELKPCDIQTLFLEFREKIYGIQYGIALEILFVLGKNNLSRIYKRIKLSYFECPLLLSIYEFFDLIFSFRENVIQAVNQLHNHILLIFKFIEDERKRNYRFVRVPC